MSLKLQFHNRQLTLRRQTRQGFDLRPQYYSSWISGPFTPILKGLHEEPLLPRPDQDISLDQVIKDFGERVCPSGSYGKIDEWDLYDESFRRLVSYAEEQGRFFEGLQPLVKGGREHDLIFDPLSSS